MALSGTSAKRRASVSQWFKQLLVGQEQQGTAKAAAAAWLGTIYGLRAAARQDGNKDWGRVGDDMIGCLEQAYLEHMGSDGAQAIEMGRRLLRIDEKIEMPKPMPVPKAAVRVVRPVMPKLPHLKELPHIKTARDRAELKASASRASKARLALKAKAKPVAKPVARPVAKPAAKPVVKVKAKAVKAVAKVKAKAKGRR